MYIQRQRVGPHACLAGCKYNYIQINKITKESSINTYILFIHILQMLYIYILYNYKLCYNKADFIPKTTKN